MALGTKDWGSAYPGGSRRGTGPTPWATARAQSSSGAGRASREKPARIRERETPRAKAGKGLRMRGSELRAPQDGDGEVEFPTGNLTRYQPRPWRRARRPHRSLRPQRDSWAPGPHVLGGELWYTQCAASPRVLRAQCGRASWTKTIYAGGAKKGQGAGEGQGGQLRLRLPSSARPRGPSG